MIDPAQLPLLLKAIDFVFEEAHKVLADRRERAKIDNVSPTGDAGAVNPIIAPKPEKGEEVRQELLTSKVDELLWQNNQAEIQHLVKLLEIYTRNYHLASEQYARWGEALVPPIIVHNMQDAENSVVESLKKLEIILSKVYKKDINLID